MLAPGATQLELFPPEVPRSVKFAGREPGALETTHDDRLQEVARLTSQGHKPGEIAEMLGITQVRASELIKNAKHAGMVDFFHEGRNVTTREMVDRRVKLGRKGYDVLQKRLNYIHQKTAKEIDSRDMDDAFKALDITEHTAKETKSGGTVVQTTGPVAVFSADDLKKAANVSARILSD